MLPYLSWLPVLLGFQCLQCTVGKTKTEYLSSTNCPTITYYMEEGDTLTVNWQGDAIDCKFKIYGEGGDWGDIEHVCYRIDSFSLSSCETELNLYNSNRGSVATKSYECNDYPVGTTYCADSLTRIGIESGHNPGSDISVFVYINIKDAESGYESSSLNMTPIIIGVAVTSSLLIIGMIVCIIFMRRRAMQQQSSYAQPVNPTPMVTYQYQPTSQQMDTPPQPYQPQPPTQTAGGYVHPTTVVKPM